MASKTTFIILSFEGPDRYAHAGGLGSRVGELATSLACMGFETHLFFVGDPHQPGLETMQAGKLVLHRWCQWISRHHPNGVYDGEDGKLSDWERSLPPWLEKELLEPKVAAGASVVVMAEEWHTAGSITALHEILAHRGWQDRVPLLWNANNTFSFDRINWEALKRAATITTVSRYMKHVMWRLGVDPRVIPNGIQEDWFQPRECHQGADLSALLRHRLSLVKVARWDPDKRWDMAVDAVAQLKQRGLRPLLLARGGLEAHRLEVLARAQTQGLGVASVYWEDPGVDSLVQAVRPALDADVVNLQGYLSREQRGALFHAADAVLANSGVEPFGLVGLETMAVGGLAFVGCSGEDYVTPGYDAISLQSSDPGEIVHHVVRLRRCRETAVRLRQAARLSAERYAWPGVIRRVLLPSLEQLGLTVSDGEGMDDRDLARGLESQVAAGALDMTGAQPRHALLEAQPVGSFREGGNICAKTGPGTL
jgi:glycosyltransferase involved in cell wall biosynthesis